MPFFECTVSRVVITDDLKVARVKETVYVEAKDELDAKSKAGHPKSWLTSALTFRKADKSSSFLLTVDECRRLAHDEVRAMRPADLAFASTLTRTLFSAG
jgi:hypothetical protein